MTQGEASKGVFAAVAEPACRVLEVHSYHSGSAPMARRDFGQLVPFRLTGTLGSVN